MGVVSAPLFSLTASGTIGKALTYSRWKGIKYVRTRVIPQNPRSTDQQEVRTAFRYLQLEYGQLDSLAQAIWESLARGRPYTARNRFTAINNELVRQAGDLSTFQLSPGQGPIPPMQGATATGGAGVIGITAPNAPTVNGWTVFSATATAIPDTDPYTPPLVLGSYTNADFTPAYAFDINVPIPGDYRVFAYYRFQSDADPNIYRYGAQEDLGTETVT